MVLDAKRIGTLALRLIVGLVLLGWPRVGNAQGTWSVISLPQQLGEVADPLALAVDEAGNLYVADGTNGIQKRDAQGNWSVIATGGTAFGQVGGVFALAVDTAGHLYVADNGHGIQKRDAQGNWSVIAAGGTGLGQVWGPSALAMDAAGNLYVADGSYGGRIQKRDAQGNWSVLAPAPAVALAVDASGNLYFAEPADGSSNPGSRIWKRDARGNWSVIAAGGTGLGQVFNPTALAVDAAGNLYVADTRNHRVQVYEPSP